MRCVAGASPSLAQGSVNIFAAALTFCCAAMAARSKAKARAKGAAKAKAAAKAAAQLPQPVSSPNSRQGAPASASATSPPENQGRRCQKDRRDLDEKALPRPQRRRYRSVGDPPLVALRRLI